jgi:hypothetical protein
MKRILFLVALASTTLGSSAFAQESINGWMPPDSPPSIEVANVPMGSGMPGQSVGYTEATPVSDGLYQVPGFMPYQSTAASMWPRVVDVTCHNQSGTWYCNGYHIDGVLERGEDIYVRPQFIQVSSTAAVPMAKPVVPPLPVVHHVLKHFTKPQTPVCK